MEELFQRRIALTKHCGSGKKSPKFWRAALGLKLDQKQRYYVYSSDQQEITSDSVDSHIAQIQAALEMVKDDLTKTADSFGMARKLQVLKSLLDELSVMQHIKQDLDA